jgi:hypothetical protein
MATAFFASGKKGIDLSSYRQYCGPIDAALAVSASYFFPQLQCIVPGMCVEACIVSTLPCATECIVPGICVGAYVQTSAPTASS